MNPRTSLDPAKKIPYLYMESNLCCSRVRLSYPGCVYQEYLNLHCTDVSVDAEGFLIITWPHLMSSISSHSLKVSDDGVQHTELLGFRLLFYGFVGYVCSTNFYLLFYPSSTHVRALLQLLLETFSLSPAELVWSRVGK
jgi:hypothetical protein